MILEHIKIGFRHLVRDKFYTLLNFSGLCIGLLIALYIATWIIDELNYDRYFRDADLIYRVERDFNYNGISREMPVTSFNYAKALQADFPEITLTTRLYPMEIAVQDHHQVYRKQLVHFADSNFFGIFNFRFISGNPDRALDHPNAVVLTRDAALKFFGREQVLGESIKVKVEDFIYHLKVTGITENIPENTHFHPEIFIPLPLLKEYYQQIYDEWRVNIGYTYIKINDRKNLAKLKAQIPGFLLQHVGPAYSTMLLGDDDINDAIEVKLKNIQDIHLTSHLEYELETNGDIKNVLLLSSVAILILLLAITNYVNLTNARSENRSLEVGIRKVVGSSKSQLVLHFFLESLLLIFFAFALSILLMFLLSSFYEDFSGKTFHWVFFNSAHHFALLAGTLIVVSVLAGIYPALFVSGFGILKSIKGKNQAKGMNTRIALVIFQFFISIGLVTFSMLMALQINLIHTRDIGFDPRNLVVIDVDNQEVRSHFDSFKEEILRLNHVKDVTGAGTVPVNQIYPSLTVRKPFADDDLFFSYMGVNYDFFKTLHIDLLAGRLFSREFSDTSEVRYIINEKASRRLGFVTPDDAISRYLETKSHLESTYRKGQIIGVVRDFNFKSLHKDVEPLGIRLLPGYLNAIFVRIEPGHRKATLQHIQKTWENRFPQSEFNYSFLSDSIRKQYLSDDELQSKLVFSTLLALVIGSLGLFGLSLYILQQRTKEIGVRKVNGATSRSLVLLFSKRYVRWITWAAMVACPTSYFFFTGWLNNFAIKIGVGYFWGVFVLAWLTITLFSLITVIAQTIKYSRLNPVDVLKYE
ncbi:MAG: FtsX-like permease family protein [Bacteroidales bacterium]|jgi:putative ABC transport system permease protein|nr:FtsX-like permease family protein [Bacteroidales bacterium]